MKDYLFFDIENNSLNLRLIASFSCPTTKKNYVIIDNQNKIFNNSSNYNNLDVLEIASFTGNDIKLKEIPEEDWQSVKNFIYEQICAKIKTAHKF